MNVFVFYRPNSEHERLVDEFVARLLKDHGVTAEKVSLDTAGGVSKAEVYEIWQFPSVLVSRPEGQTIKLWIGTLPPTDEVSYNAHL